MATHVAVAWYLSTASDLAGSVTLDSFFSAAVRTCAMRSWPTAACSVAGTPCAARCHAVLSADPPGPCDTVSTSMSAPGEGRTSRGPTEMSTKASPMTANLTWEAMIGRP